MTHSLSSITDNSLIIAAHPDDELLWFAAILHKVLHTRAHVHADLVIHGDVKPNNFSKFFEGGVLKSEKLSSAACPSSRSWTSDGAAPSKPAYLL